MNSVHSEPVAQVDEWGSRFGLLDKVPEEVRFRVMCPLDAPLRDNATVVGLKASLASGYREDCGPSNTYIHNGIILFRFPRFSHLWLNLGEIHSFRHCRVSVH